MGSEPTVTFETALAAKSSVLRLLEAARESFDLESVRSVGIGRGSGGTLCVRLTVAPESLERAREIVPGEIDGVAVEFRQGGTIRAEPADLSQ